MSSTIDNWVSRLATIQLPILESSKEALLVLQDDAKISASGIASVILADPMLTLQLMRLANANRSDVFAQRITTAEHAVMLLGFSTVFARLTEMPTLEDALPKSVQPYLLSVVSRACHAASQAREWAVQRADTSSEEVYVSALLHSVAELALWVAEPEQMIKAAKARRKQSWLDAELAQFGFPLIELSRALAEQWNMPPLVSSAMQWEAAEGQPRSGSITLVNRMLKNAEWGWWHAEVFDDLEEIALLRRQSIDDVTGQVHRTAVDVARRYTFPGVTPIAAWLPLQKGIWPDDASEPATQSDAFQAIMDEIIGHKDGSLTLSELLTLVIRGLRDGAGLRRIVFALLTQDRAELKPRYFYGAEASSPLRFFHFDMRQKHLFSMLMAKQQSVWLSKENRAKYMPVLNTKIDQVTSGHEFYAMSLSVQGKVVGMLYGDRAGGQLDVAAYEKFKQLCTQATLGMAKLSKSLPTHS